MPTILGLPAAAAPVDCHRRAGSGLRRCLVASEAVRNVPVERRKVWAQQRAAALGEIDIVATAMCCLEAVHGRDARIRVQIKLA